MSAQRFLVLHVGSQYARAVVADAVGAHLGQHQLKLQQFQPAPGWVQQDPEDIWQAVLEVCQVALKRAGLTAADLVAMAIANQRETTVVWDRQTGAVQSPALTWADQRAQVICERLSAAEANKVRERTGLPLTAQFSGPKLAWILDHAPAVRVSAEVGQLAYGTLDSFLLWRFTKGRVHATDCVNASRSLLFNLSTHTWDPELLALFKIPAAVLPEVLDNDADFGVIDDEWLGYSLPIRALMGDQQAALLGHGCATPGMAKCSYRTSGFLMMNAGPSRPQPAQQLAHTLACRFGGVATYAVESAIFPAMSGLRWLQDSLNLFDDLKICEREAKTVAQSAGVYFFPPGAYLGAAVAPNVAETMTEGALVGMQAGTLPAHILRASLEAIAFQTLTVVQQLRQAKTEPISVLHVDGELAERDWLLQLLADITAIPVTRSQWTDVVIHGMVLALQRSLPATAGAALVAPTPVVDAEHMPRLKFTPKLDEEYRMSLYDGWLKWSERLGASVD